MVGMGIGLGLGLRQLRPAAAAASLPWMQVATAVYQPSTVTGAGTTSMLRKSHYARDNVTALQLGYLTSYRSTTLGRVALGSTLPIKAWIEYPSGTYTAVNFSGSATPTLADNTLTISDSTAVTIPTGAQFWTWTWANGVCPAGTSSITNILSTSLGEGCKIATSAVPTAPSGTAPTGANQMAMCPVLILAQTSVKSCAVFGTSRTISQGGTTNAVGDRGAICQVIGPTLAYANYGIQGDCQTAWLHDPALTQLAAYFTHIVGSDSTNNAYVQTGTLLGMEAFDSRWAARFIGKPYIRQTIEPNATSTDSWVTTANQTATAAGIIMDSWNTYVRGASDAPYLEVGSAVIDGTTTTKWAGASPAYTADGLHPNTTGVAQQVSAGLILPATITGATNFATAFAPVMTSVSATYSSAAPKFGTQNLSGGNLANYGIAPTSYPHTVECWFKTSTAGNYTIFSTSGTSTLLSINAGAVGGNGGGKAFTASGTYNDNVWHHAAIVVTQTGSTLYVDGVSISTAVAPTAIPNAAGFATAIGAQGRATLSGGTPNFSGNTDEFAIWNYAKYTGAFTPPSSAYVGNEAGLIAVCHLDGNSTIVVGPAA